MSFRKEMWEVVIDLHPEACRTALLRIIELPEPVAGMDTDPAEVAWYDNGWFDCYNSALSAIIDAD